MDARPVVPSFFSSFSLCSSAAGCFCHWATLKRLPRSDNAGPRNSPSAGALPCDASRKISISPATSPQQAPLPPITPPPTTPADVTLNSGCTNAPKGPPSPQSRSHPSEPPSVRKTRIASALQRRLRRQADRPNRNAIRNAVRESAVVADIPSAKWMEESTRVLLDPPTILRKRAFEASSFVQSMARWSSYASPSPARRANDLGLSL